MPFETKTAVDIPLPNLNQKLKKSTNHATVIGTVTSLGALGFGLLNLSTAGIPALTLGAVAAGFALRSKTYGDSLETTPETIWYADTSKQTSFYGKVTANYLISCLESVDAVLTHRQYKKNWWAGRTYSGVYVMIGSHGDFKTFWGREDMLNCAMAFLKIGVWRECSELEIEMMRPKRRFEKPSAMDFVAQGIDLDDALFLGRLIRNDHLDKPLDSYEVMNQGWLLYALKNGMFIAKRGSSNLTWRVFFDRDQFYRFFDRAMQKEKRKLLPSEDLGLTVEDTSAYASEDDLMQAFLNNIVFITA